MVKGLNYIAAHVRQWAVRHRLALIPLVVIACCAATRAQTAPVVRLYPVDDTWRDRSFRTYAGKLRSAVDARDPAALRKLVAEDVVVGPSEDDKGWARFTARWRPGDRENPVVWTALSDLLSLGFIREHPSLYLSPYLVWRFPRELSVAAHLVVIRDKVPLRESPSLRAAAAASLSFEIVRRLGPAEGGEGLGEWVPVGTFDGKTGYLNTRDVMSPMMPRAQFALNKGRWAMVALEGPDR